MKKALVFGSVLLIMVILVWLLAAGGKCPAPGTDNQKTERIAGLSRCADDSAKPGKLEPGSIVPMPERKTPPAPAPEKETVKKKPALKKAAAGTGDENRNKNSRTTIMVNGKKVDPSAFGKSFRFNPEKEVEKYYAALQERLSLSPEQVETIKKIFDTRPSRQREVSRKVRQKAREMSQQQRQRIRELRQDGFKPTEADLEPYRFDRREERRRLNEELDCEIENELAKVMTQDQYDKFSCDEKLKKGPPSLRIVVMK